jgi:hypothetical protein
MKRYAWVGATILAFYGAGRLGEMLRCCREDLVLPDDVVEPPVSFLQGRFQPRIFEGEVLLYSSAAQVHNT